MHKSLIASRCPNIDLDNIDWTGFTGDVIVLFADLIYLNKVSPKMNFLTETLTVTL